MSKKQRVTIIDSFESYHIKHNRKVMALAHAFILINLFLIPVIFYSLNFSKSSSPQTSAQTSCAQTLTSGSITSALNALSAGQTLCLDGVFNTNVQFTKAGVILASKNSSSPATINGQIWFKSSSDGAQIKNLKLVGTGIAAPSIIIEADSVVVQGNDISNPGTRGICVSIGDTTNDIRVGGVLIDNNRIHNCGTGNKLDHGIYVAHTLSSPVTKITNNYIYKNSMFGIQYYPDAQGTITEYNIIDANPSGVTFSGQDGFKSNNNIFRNNIVSDIQSTVLSGMRAINYCWGSCGTTGTGSGNLVENNCFYDAVNGYYQSNMQGVTIGSNITGQNPLYQDKSNANYKLSSSSPCLGKGPQSAQPVPASGGGDSGGSTGGGTSGGGTTTGGGSNSGGGGSVTNNSGGSTGGGTSGGGTTSGGGNNQNEQNATNNENVDPSSNNQSSDENIIYDENGNIVAIVDNAEKKDNKNTGIISESLSKEVKAGPLPKTTVGQIVKYILLTVLGLSILVVSGLIALTKIPALEGLRENILYAKQHHK